ncbi:YegP family protein [Arthrobacter sp. 2MCAF14]|uniref:YegP family protein n=1 Tax=Arthrobacter sp. 2MCAF14 TaxID=3232982 RepID=UPI003F8E2C9C
MAGMFEFFVDPESAFRFPLTAPDGTVIAVSKPFDTKSDAVAGIAAVREYVGMGLITDHCTTSTNAAPPATCTDPGSQTGRFPAHAKDRLPHPRQGGSRGRGNPQPFLSAGEGRRDQSSAPTGIPAD